MNIMVVDDERVQIESVHRGLKSKGYGVLEASNCEAALKQLHDNHKRIDMVITDYAMPGMNGMELLKKIRESNASLPVIMMTAYGEKKLVIDALRNRCDSFIEKPFNLDELLGEIQRAEVNRVQNTNSHRLAEFIPRLIHQINNPLMSIMGCAELGMLQMDDTEEMKKRMAEIIKATEKIQEINGEILDIGQRREAKIGKTDIGGIIEDCLDMFRDLMLLKEVTLEKSLDDHLCVWGNRFGLEQVFKNLILNAIDSMDGRPEKRLTLRVVLDHTASSVSVCIEDTGGGIPEESIDNIFTPYLTTKENGTGLGLAVVKEVVEMHKGEIHVESQIGQGTVFKVVLPAMN